ncbi:hypothetical protein F5Y04DRAFT_278923 [Hypomontagnella monticulosa]|nr:hypothetical protein F5Y04DRAFT_278923 [Hypomontagnella monticulosa]
MLNIAYAATMFLALTSASPLSTTIRGDSIPSTKVSFSRWPTLPTPPIPSLPSSWPPFPTSWPPFPSSFPSFPTSFPSFPTSFPSLPTSLIPIPTISLGPVPPLPPIPSKIIGKRGITWTDDGGVTWTGVPGPREEDADVDPVHSDYSRGGATTRTVLSDACMYIYAMTSSVSCLGATTPGSFVAQAGALPTPW